MKPTVRAEREDGKRTRATILKKATDLASVDGLGGLTVGRIAGELGMSKSGVFAHFGSMEELQLAAIETAAEIYRAEIVLPARQEPPGLSRVIGLIDAFLSYSRRRVFPGGCFFGTTIVEFDSRPGRLRERLARAHLDWVGTISRFLVEARHAGDIDADADIGQLAFEIASLLTTADWIYTLHDDPEALARGRRAVLRVLSGAVTDESALVAAAR
jgi:AcrR family transcriptional regulator